MDVKRGISAVLLQLRQGHVREFVRTLYDSALLTAGRIHQQLSVCQPCISFSQGDLKVVAQQGTLSGGQVSKRLQPLAGAQGVFAFPSSPTAVNGKKTLQQPW